ncbi:hypothetical protein SAMN05216360_10525 [Methylobacterium phyllostachyos]|uniref:Uncharacterized protein n=1 Tax=Methylobacterium phyllostachyos TaxID=582672 RepID=A0A1G9XTG1_9HYPH|nr:hypothetical protein [Methylobacterium phyllostachyos]SDN00020.1 hypothetical protein SAMN05216360_10525 [Methylobacterium phyllostachyos]
MVSTVSSSSTALTVLQTQAPGPVASGQRDQDPLRAFLDPRSVHALAPQSLDALLKLRTELRRDPVQEPREQKDVSPTSSAGVSKHSGSRHAGMLAWENEGASKKYSNLDTWKERMQFRQAHSFDPMAQLVPHLEVPLDSPLSPWNSPDVIEELKDRDRHGAISSSRERAFLASDAAIYKGMAETPPEDVARIKAEGGEIWYEDSQFFDRPSDREFFWDAKNLALYGGSLEDPIDPSDELSQALLNGTAQMIRGSNIPGYYERTFSYNMYAYNSGADQYKWIGGWGRGESNSDVIREDLIKKNPTMHVACLGLDGDTAFVLYPKTSPTASAATASASSSATGTGTSRPATAAH